ncbi:sugar transferase [Streptococcus infantis]|uniref:sugar transferase n=1 Tax=Streptococcus infantis TaxID=68892 RepID=UPI0039C04976
MEGRGFYNITLALLQSILVSLLAYVLIAISETDIVLNTVFVLFFLHFVAFYISGYGKDFFKRGQYVELVKTIKYIIFYALLISFSSFFLKEKFVISRRGMVYLLSLYSVLNYLLSFFVKRYWRIFKHNVKGSRNILLITAMSHTEKVLDRLLTANDVPGRIVAVSVLDMPEFTHDKVAVVPREQLLSYATHGVVDEVFVNLPSEDYDIETVISQFEIMGIDVTVNLNTFDKSLGRDKQIHGMAGLNVVTFSTNFYNPSHIIAKRILDICGAIVGLLLCGIASLFLVPLIRKDGGPAIFSQTRIGKNGRHFTFYKFRSMRIDAEAIKEQLMDQNTMQGGMFKIDNDPRVTKIGQFIRKTSLDELPQFWNVLIGDMSLVGTRPPTVDEYEKYTPEQKRRLSFKPGITGLWQISGRSKITDFDDVVKLDVAYIDNWTIWKDIEILLKTVKVVLMRDGAK